MLESVVRLVFSLAAVIGLLLLLARVSARRFRGSGDAPVHVLHRQPLSRTTSVAVVTVGQRVLVLGATEHRVSVLAELDPEELPEPAETPAVVAQQERPSIKGSVLSTQTWKQAFAAAGGRTGLGHGALVGSDDG